MLLSGMDKGARPVIASLGATQIVGYGALYYAYAVLAPKMAAEFAVTQATLFAIFSAGLMLSGLTAPMFGRRIDRYGAAMVMAIGSAVAALLLVGLAFAPNIWVFAVFVILVEVISFAVLYDAAFATLARLAPNNTRAAITQLTLIAGFASTIFWPLTGWLAEVLGWRGTYLCFAALNLCVALPLHLWIARRPAPDTLSKPRETEDTSPAPIQLSGPLAERAFWLVGTGFALSGMVIAAVTIHLVPILLARDLGGAAFLISMVMGPAQVLIRLIDATLWRKSHPVSVALVAAAALPLAVIILLIPGPAILTGLCFAALLGTGGGLTSIVRGAVPIALFGRDGIGLRLARLASIRSLMGASAPFLFAYASAQIGQQAALWLVAAIGLAGFAVTVALWRTVQQAQAVSAGT